MKYGPLFTVATAGASAFVVLPLFAQEDGGLSVSLDFSQRFETASNLGLEVPDEGNTNLATTSLMLNLDSQTRTQDFSLSFGGLFREGDIPSGAGAETGFLEPQAALSFTQEGANAEFKLDAKFRQTDIAFDIPLSDFVDATGVVVIPPDFDNLSGTGKRNNFSFDTSLETGKNSTVGFLFEAGVSDLSYENTSSSSLVDNTRTNFDATVFLRPSETLTGRTELHYDLFDDQDTLDTERETWSTLFGVESEISSGTMVDISLGYEEVITDRNTGKTTESGLIGGLGIDHELANGSVFGDFTLSRNQDGQRYTVNVGREIELPRGSLRGSVGTTSLEGNSYDFVFNALFVHQLPQGAINLSADRQVSTDDNDNERIASSLDFGYDHSINNISSVGLDIKFGLVESTSTASEVERYDITASYNRELTRDWSMVTGVSYRTRDSSSVGFADSTSVFFTLDRSFDLIKR